MAEIDKTNKFVPEDEVDLLALAKTVWGKRKILVSVTVSFMILGLAVALLLPKEFTASSTFIPQTSEGSMGGNSLGGLASLAGINLGSMGGSSEIPPSLYPKIVSSASFRKALLESKINVEGLEETVSYKEYFEKIHSPGFLGSLKQYTIGIPGLIIKLFNGEQSESSIETENGFINVSKEEFEHFKRLEKQLAVTPNDKEGFVSISFVLPEPFMAAQMTRIAQELLQKELISYKISNAREQLKFTEERFEEKKAEFEKIQSRLSGFRDRNQNIISAAAQNQLQRLEAEYNFAFNIYTELAKQLEQAKLQVAKDTPIFSIIQPVTIPTEKSAPKRPLILLVFTILGFIVALGYIFGLEFLKGVKDKWNQD